MLLGIIPSSRIIFSGNRAGACLNFFRKDPFFSLLPPVYLYRKPEKVRKEARKMKGIITEIKGRKAVLLKENGELVQISNRSYRLGQEVRRTPAPALASAAAAAVLLFGGGGAAYALPYTHVTLDMNPSVEYTLNVFDRVLAAEGLDEDGEALLEGLELRNLTIDEAAEVLVEELEEDGYFQDETEDEILIAVESQGEERKLQVATRLQEKLELKTQNMGLEMAIMAVTMNQEERQEALGMGLSMGQYYAIRQAVGPDKDPAEIPWNQYKDMNMKELQDLAKERVRRETEVKEGQGPMEEVRTRTENQTQTETQTETKTETRSETQNQAEAPGSGEGSAPQGAGR